jgi:D-amino-acid oxidase
VLNLVTSIQQVHNISKRYIDVLFLTTPKKVLINSPVYLKWLEQQFRKLGGKIIKQSIAHIYELFNFFPHNNHATTAVVINCTGLGAKYLGGVQDDALFPTRGQTMIVNAPNIKKTITHVGTEGITYVIPRSDGTVILGGTANKNDL